MFALGHSSDVLCCSFSLSVVSLFVLSCYLSAALVSLTCMSLGLIENVIRQNQWGGADIRRGGDPILRNNFICHGYSDGVVVGERGRGLIEGNHIYGEHLFFMTLSPWE